MVRPVLGDAVLGHAEFRGRGELLQAGLPVQTGAEQRGTLQQRVEQPVDQLAGGVETVLEVDRADQRLGGVGEDARLLPATGHLLAPAQVEVRAEPVVPEGGGHAREGVHVHDARPQLGELPLGQLGVVAVQPLGDDDREHRVAEELQPLVGGQSAVLVRVRAVGERQGEELLGDLHTQRREKGPAVIREPLWGAFRHPPVVRPG